MKAVLHHPSANRSSSQAQHPHLSVPVLWRKFISWATAQQKNNFLWLAVGLVGHATVFTLSTLIIIYVTGNVFALFIAAVAAMMMVVVTNLAVAATRYCIPVFFLSIVIDVLIIIAAIVMKMWG